MEALANAYDTVFYKRPDARVSDWLLMTSPWPLALIIAGYLFLIKLVLPAHMRSHPPYELKSVIRCRSWPTLPSHGE
ncbi:unnamed protein product, partial [Iphiclides podalirius]